jgi:hypothetical protein
LDEREVVAQVERREEAVRQLKGALLRCRASDLTTNEILAVVRPLLLGDDGILIEGSLVEHLTDDEASTVIRILYGGLSGDATFSFIARRTPAQVYALCDDADISREDLTITAEAHFLRVSITKVQS